MHETCNMEAASNRHKILFEKPEQMSNLGSITIRREDNINNDVQEVSRVRTGFIWLSEMSGSNSCEGQ